MSAEQHPAGRPRPRPLLIALAGIALVLLLGCAVLFFGGGDVHPRSRARAHAGEVNPGELAAEIQADIAERQLQRAERLSQVNRHELPDPDDQPPPGEEPAIRQVERVTRHFLAGYLPYEVGHLSHGARADIVTTTSRSLALSLLSHVPIVPPPQQQAPPPQGRPVGMRTVLSADQREAQVYVEVAYGLDNEGFTLIFAKRGENRWQVVAFHG
jgi:hypothetical protein